MCCPCSRGAMLPLEGVWSQEPVTRTCYYYCVIHYYVYLFGATASGALGFLVALHSVINRWGLVASGNQIQVGTAEQPASGWANALRSSARAIWVDLAVLRGAYVVLGIRHASASPLHGVLGPHPLTWNPPLQILDPSPIYPAPLPTHSPPSFYYFPFKEGLSSLGAP